MFDTMGQRSAFFPESKFVCLFYLSKNAAEHSVVLWALPLPTAPFLSVSPAGVDYSSQPCTWIFFTLFFQPQVLKEMWNPFQIILSTFSRICRLSSNVKLTPNSSQSKRWWYNLKVYLVTKYGPTVKLGYYQIIYWNQKFARCKEMSSDASCSWEGRCTFIQTKLKRSTRKTLSFWLC